MPTLRSKIIRLAHVHPEFQPHLLPLLKRAAWYDRWVDSLDGLGGTLADLFADAELVAENDPNLRRIGQVLSRLEGVAKGKIEDELDRFMKGGVDKVDFDGCDGTQELEGTASAGRSRSRWDPADVDEWDESVVATIPDSVQGITYFDLDLNGLVDLYWKALHHLLPGLEKRWLEGILEGEAKQGGTLYDMVQEQVGAIVDANELSLGNTVDELSEAARDEVEVSYDDSHVDVNPSVSVSCSQDALVTAVDIESRSLIFNLTVHFSTSVSGEIG